MNDPIREWVAKIAKWAVRIALSSLALAVVMVWTTGLVGWVTGQTPVRALFSTPAGPVEMKRERVTIKTTSNPYFLLSATPALGYEVFVFRNSMLIDSKARGGADDYTITGNKITMSTASKGLTLGDNYQFIYFAVAK